MSKRACEFRTLFGKPVRQTSKARKPFTRMIRDGEYVNNPEYSSANMYLNHNSMDVPSMQSLYDTTGRILEEQGAKSIMAMESCCPGGFIGGEGYFPEGQPIPIGYVTDSLAYNRPNAAMVQLPLQYESDKAAILMSGSNANTALGRSPARATAYFPTRNYGDTELAVEYRKQEDPVCCSRKYAYFPCETAPERFSAYGSPYNEI